MTSFTYSSDSELIKLYIKYKDTSVLEAKFIYNELKRRGIDKNKMMELYPEYFI